MEKKKKLAETREPTYPSVAQGQVTKMLFIYSYIDLKYGTHSWVWSGPLPTNRENQMLAASHTAGLPGNRTAILGTSEELKALGEYWWTEPYNLCARTEE